LIIIRVNWHGSFLFFIYFEKKTYRTNIVCVYLFKMIEYSYHLYTREGLVMPTVIRDKQINFKVNSEYFELAKVVFQENGLDITSAFNEFVQEVAISKTLPFKTVEEKEREKLIARLQEEVSTSYEALRADKGLSVEEARKAVLG